MILNDVVADVSYNLNAQKQLGIQITALNKVPEVGPSNKGLWNQILGVTAVFVDMKSSTELNGEYDAATAARAYTYFVRSMAVICDRFSADYIEVQGDGVFGLFSGSDSLFEATACAITMRTIIEHDIAKRFQNEERIGWQLAAGIGIDQGPLLVRRLGLRTFKENEVWAGKPVNVAAKLSSLAKPNQICVSDRVYAAFDRCF